MKLRNTFFIMVGIWCLLCLCLRCGMNLSSLQTGRTLGKKNVETSLSFDYSKMPILFDFNDNELREEDAIDRGVDIVSNTQVGLTDRFDLGFQTSLRTTALGMDIKYQLSNDKNSLVATSVGVGGGLNAGGGFLVLPLYFSLHPSDHIDIYFSPRHILQEGSYYFEGEWIKAFGFNAGVSIGSKRLKFVLHGGYFSGNAGKYDLNLNTIGLGIKFKINASSSKRSERKGGQGPFGPNREKGNIPK